jgi:hypothetical protein
MGQKLQIELEVDNKGAIKSIKSLNDNLVNLNETTENTKKNTSALKKGLIAVGGAGKKVGKGGLKAVAFGLKGIGKAYKAAGIGLIVSAFGLLFAAFKENQAVVDKFNVVMQTIASVGKQVGDVIAGVYKNVSQSTENFDALGKVLKGVLDIALVPVRVAFQTIKGAIIGAQLAWEQSWLGGNDDARIAELKSQLDEVGQEFINIKDDVVDASSSIANNFTEAVSEATSIAGDVIEGVKEISIEAAYENAEANIQLKKSADIARAANQGLIEDYDRQAEQQRQIRDNDLINIEDRIKANELLKQKLEEQEKLMLENVKAIQDAAQAQFDLTGKDEDYIALLEAKNEVKAVEAQIEGFMSEQESNRVALQKEKIELAQSETDATAERQIAERNFNAEMMENDVLRLQAQQSNAIKEKELEEKRLKDKRDSYQAGTQAFQDAQNELDAYSEESARNQVKIQKDLDKAKETQMTQTLGNLATIVGKNSKFGKAIAIVQAIRDTYAGATKALSQGGIFGFIGAAAVTAAGIANVKAITSTPDPTPPAGASVGGGSSIPPTPSTPPAFNIVGQGETSQLADAIGSQASEPVRAYVVSNDVTTAQGLERNIVEGATI